MKNNRVQIVCICLCLLLTFVNNRASANEPYDKAYKRGVELFNSWKYKDALDAFIDADKLYPQNGFIYLYVGQIMFFADRYQDSYNYTKQALSYFNPDDSIGKANAFLHLAFLAQSVVFHDKIDGLSEDDAALYFDMAVNSAPHYAKAYNERGNYYNINKKMFSRSDADYLKAIELEPSEVEPYSRIIWSYLDRGLTGKAMEYCLKCIANVKEYPYHHHTLVKLLLKEGKKEEARNLLWEAFLKSNGYYFQGMETVAQFPKEDQDWFRRQINDQIKKNPNQKHWKEYF